MIEWRMRSSVVITGTAETISGSSITCILFTCVKLVSNWSFIYLQRYKWDLDLIWYHFFARVHTHTHVQKNFFHHTTNWNSRYHFAFSFFTILYFIYVTYYLFIYFSVQFFPSFYCFSIFDVCHRILVLFEVSVKHSFSRFSKMHIISSNFHAKCFLSSYVYVRKYSSENVFYVDICVCKCVW